jgi:hypothetical protein
MCVDALRVTEFGLGWDSNSFVGLGKYLDVRHIGCLLFSASLIDPPQRHRQSTVRKKEHTEKEENVSAILALQLVLPISIQLG